MFRTIPEKIRQTEETMIPNAQRLSSALFSLHSRLLILILLLLLFLAA